MGNCYVCNGNFNTDIPNVDVDTGYAICDSCYMEEIENQSKIYELSK